MHIKNVLLRGRGELFLAPKSFPSPPQTPPLPSKRALQKQANDQPAIGKAIPTGAKAFRLPGCDLAQRKRHERTNSTGTGKRVFRKTTAGTKSSAMHEKSTPAGCPQRDALPLSTSGSRMQARLGEGKREDRGRGGPALSSSFRISGIHTTGREQEWQ